MTKSFITAGILLATVFLSAPSFAGPPCPQSADRLEEFAVCMRPYSNGLGQVLTGYAPGAMDHHTAQLMNSMHRAISSPQVIPSIPSAVSFASNMVVAATATSRMPYPYNYWMMGNPYMWFGMGAGLPIYP